MTHRLSRKSALRLMMVGGGLMAATPAALPQGAIIPCDAIRLRNKGVTIPCDIARSRNKGAKIPCDTVRSRNKGRIPDTPRNVKAMNPCELRNKGGMVQPQDLKNPTNKGQIPEAPCLLRNKGGLKK